MNSQNFILRLRLPPGMTSDEAIDLLGAAECTDPLVDIGEAGVLALMFDRPVALSTMAAMARCIPEAVVLGFSTDSGVPA